MEGGGAPGDNETAQFSFTLPSNDGNNSSAKGEMSRNERSRSLRNLCHRPDVTGDGINRYNGQIG